MDTVKEQMADAIGPNAAMIANELGDAAVRQLLACAKELLSRGISVVVEGFFQSDRYSTEFAELASHADSVLVHLMAEDAVLKHRYEKRALDGVRHWIHGDKNKLGTLTPELPAYMAARLNLDIPQIVIDTTTYEMDVQATSRLIQQARHQGPGEKSA